MRQISIVSVLAILVFTGCLKNKAYHPCTDCNRIARTGDYFPGNPGSWWRYTAADGSETRYAMSPDYNLLDDECLPIFSNLSKGLKGNTLRHVSFHGLGASSINFSPIYSLVLDSIFICPVSFSTLADIPTSLGLSDIYYRRTTTNLDTSLNVNGTEYSDVIEVYEFNLQNPSHRYLDYFAKDIGLIRRDSLDAADSTIHIQILGLNEYHLGLDWLCE